MWFASGCSWRTPFRFRNRSGSARGTFQPCSLLAVVSNMSYVTVLVMVYLPGQCDWIPISGFTDKLFFFFREMTAFFRWPTTNFRRLENSNNFQRNDNFFQNLSMDCSGAIYLVLGTFLLPILRYPLPRPKTDVLIPAARSRSSRGPAKYAQISSKQAQNFRRQTQNFRTHTTIFRT